MRDIRQANRPRSSSTPKFRKEGRHAPAQHAPQACATKSMDRYTGFKALLIMFSVIFFSGCASYHSDSGQASYTANQAVRSAYSQLGKNYISGGSSPRQGFDCSGLVYWAYRSNGVKIPRVTRDQAKSGRAVAKNNPVAGDIMVFRVGGGGTGLHTGLYAGGNQFIHSPKPGAKVRLDNVNNVYWQKKLISVRRVSG